MSSTDREVQPRNQDEIKTSCKKYFKSLCNFAFLAVVFIGASLTAVGEFYNNQPWAIIGYFFVGFAGLLVIYSTWSFVCCVNSSSEENTDHFSHVEDQQCTSQIQNSGPIYGDEPPDFSVAVSDSPHNNFTLPQGTMNSGFLSSYESIKEELPPSYNEAVEHPVTQL
ncbi:uncharacterized protein LOC143446517 isoform X1 [Clavelina lepadiformis]|uniref:uncharacterized protein LOC143446517 isoform X1 n=1 Tax=Clavelina lepadiformis TaxID=159417 RepID=UPI0040438749